MPWPWCTPRPRPPRARPRPSTRTPPRAPRRGARRRGARRAARRAELRVRADATGTCMPACRASRTAPCGRGGGGACESFPFLRFASLWFGLREGELRPAWQRLGVRLCARRRDVSASMAPPKQAMAGPCASRLPCHAVLLFVRAVEKFASAGCVGARKARVAAVRAGDGGWPQRGLGSLLSGRSSKPRLALNKADRCLQLDFAFLLFCFVCAL